MASYPSSVAAFTTHIDGTDTIFAADVNTPNSEIVAIETGLLNGFQHDLVVLTDKNQSLGNSTHRWKNLWTSGTTQFNGVTWTWPASAGSANQLLTTDGTGTFSFTNGNGGMLQDFRLTLTTGLPVTTADVTAATTLYFSPFKGRRCTVFDGSGNATTLTSGEISIAVPASATQMYDVWVYNNSGTLTLELLAWTNDTTRATAIVLTGALDAAGVYTKSGDTTRRYVGSIRTVASGQTEDSKLNRFVYNEYNQFDRELSRQETTNSWTYNSATLHQANASASNQVNFIVGVSETPVEAFVRATATYATSSNVPVVCFGLDSTTTAAGDQIVDSVFGVGNTGGCAGASYFGLPGVGKHSLVWLEGVVNSGTAVTFYSNANTSIGAITTAAGVQSGIIGHCRG